MAVQPVFQFYAELGGYKPKIWRRFQIANNITVAPFGCILMTSFDLSDMNFRLKKIPRIYMQTYEQELTPTQRSIDLIERKYLRG